MAKRNTFGIFLEDWNGRILVCTPSGGDKDSITIPKGGKEAGEDSWQAAAREFMEEAGIDIKTLIDYAETAYELPPVRYRSGAKTLYSFYIKINMPIDVSSCVCTTYTKQGNPEVTNHRLVKKEHAKRFLHESQARALDLLEDIQWFLASNEINTRE
jgi:8-oxo-dGTP pyrophosphatase MutT (NUDIX family)